MQPGKPQGFGSVGPDHIPLLALPGNPVSSYVSFELFVRPAIRALMGLTDVQPPHRPRAAEGRQGAYLAEGPAPVPARNPRRRSGHRHAGRRRRITSGRGPRPCRRLIVVPEASTGAEPGSELEVVLLG